MPAGRGLKMTETDTPAQSRPTTYLPAVAALVALAATAFLGKSYESGLRGIDSNIHAAVSMSVTSGPTLAPRLPIPIKNFAAAAPATRGSAIDPDRVFNDHPFFIFWLNGLVMRALGPSGWSARLLGREPSPSAAWSFYWPSARSSSRARFGVCAALFLIFCRDFILTSATVSLDTALVFFILLTFYLPDQAQVARAGKVAAGIGLWVKTPLVLLVFPVALVHECLLRRPKHATPAYRLPGSIARLCMSGVIAVTVGSLIWVYTARVGGEALVRDYWTRQFWEPLRCARPW